MPNVIISCSSLISKTIGWMGITSLPIWIFIQINFSLKWIALRISTSSNWSMLSHLIMRECWISPYSHILSMNPSTWTKLVIMWRLVRLFHWPSPSRHKIIILLLIVFKNLLVRSFSRSKLIWTFSLALLEHRPLLNRNLFPHSSRDLRLPKYLLLH